MKIDVIFGIAVEAALDVVPKLLVVQVLKHFAERAEWNFSRHDLFPSTVDDRDLRQLFEVVVARFGSVFAPPFLQISRRHALYSIAVAQRAETVLQQFACLE
jgi:hypothetical protein